VAKKPSPFKSAPWPPPAGSSLARHTPPAPVGGGQRRTAQRVSLRAGCVEVIAAARPSRRGRPLPPLLRTRDVRQAVTRKCLRPRGDRCARHTPVFYQRLADVQPPRCGRLSRRQAGASTGTSGVSRRPPPAVGQKARGGWAASVQHQLRQLSSHTASQLAGERRRMPVGVSNRIEMPNWLNRFSLPLIIDSKPIHSYWYNQLAKFPITSWFYRSTHSIP